MFESIVHVGECLPYGIMCQAYLADQEVWVLFMEDGSIKQ